jgi:glutamate synthase domain-containing protein 1
MDDRLFAHEGIMSSPLLGDTNEKVILQATSDNMSDSGNFDGVLELLAKGSNRSIPECVMMMIPEVITVLNSSLMY